MTTQNFDQMTRQELKSYLLTHRDDVEAFQAYLDRFHSPSTDQPHFPAPQSIEDLAHFPDLVQQRLKKDN